MPGWRAVDNDHSYPFHLATTGQHYTLLLLLLVLLDLVTLTPTGSLRNPPPTFPSKQPQCTPTNPKRVTPLTPLSKSRVFLLPRIFVETLTALNRGRTLDLRNTPITLLRLLEPMTLRQANPGKCAPEKSGWNTLTLVLKLQLLMLIHRISPLRPGKLDVRTLLMILAGRLLSTTLSECNLGCEARFRCR